MKRFLLYFCCFEIALLAIYQFKVSTDLVQPITDTKYIKCGHRDEEYEPAAVEDYIMTHLDELGYNSTAFSSGCHIFETPLSSTAENYRQLHAFIDDLNSYDKAHQSIDTSNTKEILNEIRYGNGRRSQRDICHATRPHPDGIKALFPSEQLSRTSKNGYAEPLIPPMRHPLFCTTEENHLMDLKYLVHDFEAMCLNLKPTSRIVLIDMGASLEFHGESTQPIMDLINEFESHGFFFDHIYAFEIKKFEPQKVFESLLPEKYFASYHWINTGVQPGKDAKLNPFYSVLKKFNKDDLIIVKLDIDNTPIEQELFENLLEDDSVNELVDHFYFEHHVRIQEMKIHWYPEGASVYNGTHTIKSSFEIMNELRKKGVITHYWV